jgi:hypothetical protein
MLGRIVLMLWGSLVVTRVQLVVELLRALRRMLLKMVLLRLLLLRLLVRWLLLRLVMRLLRLMRLLCVTRVVGVTWWEKIRIHLGHQSRHNRLHVLHHRVVHLKDAFQTGVALSPYLLCSFLGCGSDLGSSFSFGSDLSDEGFTGVVRHCTSKASTFLEVGGHVFA